MRAMEKPPTNRKRRVLVADGSPIVGRRLVTSLSDFVDVEAIGPARSGQEALRLYEQHEPEGALIELLLPSMSGLNVLAKIRERNPGCLIVMMTVNDTPEVRRHCINAGADFFAHKSRDLGTVFQILRDRLGNRI